MRDEERDDLRFVHKEREVHDAEQQARRVDVDNDVHPEVRVPLKALQ